MSAPTLRLWERQGLGTARRSAGGYRLYGAADIATFRRIARMRSVEGLNAPAIRRVLAAGDDPPTRRRPGPLLGPRLRSLRRQHGLTLAQVAARAGISVSFLSALEKGEAGVSIARLRQLLGAYGTTLARLTNGAAHGPVQITRAGKRKTIAGRFENVKIEALADGPILMEAQLFEVAPRGGSEGGYGHDGEEFVYVLSGSLEVTLGRTSTYRLAPGDCLYYASTNEHSWRNRGTRPARLLWVNTPPTF